MPSPSRFFSEDELRGALIVDSEGLVYGKAGYLKINASGVYIVGLVETRGRSIAVDKDRLVEMLLERGVHVSGSEELEYLVARAREEGLEVPYMEVEGSLEYVKGSIPVSEILWIDKAGLEFDGRREELTVIMLRTPREARYRGIHPQESPMLPRPEELEGKLVLSLEQGILGYAGEIVVGPGEPGIRVYRRRGSTGYINWLSLTKRLREAGYTEIYEALAEFRDPLKHSRLDLSLKQRVEEILRSMKADETAFRMLGESIVRGEEQSIYVDVAWSRVRKVREVILVS